MRFQFVANVFVSNYFQRKINVPKKEIWQTHLDESVHYKVITPKIWESRTGTRGSRRSRDY